MAFPGNFCDVSPGAHSELSQNSPGTIDDKGNFELPRVPVGNFADVRMGNGKMDSTGRKITGNMFNSGFSGEPFVLTKK